MRFQERFKLVSITWWTGIRNLLHALRAIQIISQFYLGTQRDYCNLSYITTWTVYTLTILTERDRETQRDTEREWKERKTLLTQTSGLSSLNKCIWLIFWGLKVTKKPPVLGKLGFSTVHAWLTFPLPWAGWSDGGSFQRLCTPGTSLATKWLVCPCPKGSWLHKHPHLQSHLLPSVPSSIALYHLTWKHITLKNRNNFNDPASLLLKKRK